MTRSKFIPIYITALLIFSVLVLGFGSWLIIPTSSSQTSHIEADTSPCFETDFTYSGNALSKENLALNNDGVEVYGSDLDYSIEWVTGDYFVSGLGSGDNKTAITAEADKGVAAGTHYYKITDNTTGQIICNYHQVTIGKQSVSVDTIANKVGFVGDELTWTVKLSGSEDKVALGSFDYSYKLLLSDYGTGGKQSATTAHSATTNVVSKTKSLSDYVSGYYKFTNVSKLNNNYEISSTLTFTVKAEILPTTRTNESTTTYYGTLVAALNATQSATSSVNVIPMQSFVYTPSGGSQTTYTSGKDYDHVISENCTVGANVTLGIPYDIGETNATSKDPTGVFTKGELAYGTNSMKNKIIVRSNKTLSSNGTIIIQGVVSGGQNGLHGSGITNGLHSQIALEDNAHIEANGNIYCYGFIDGNPQKTSVTMNSGMIKMPYTVIEHRGGTAFSAMIGGIGNASNPDLKTSAFNRFYMASVTSNLVVTDSATLTGYADLATGKLIGDGQQHNITEIKLVGNTSSYLIQLSDGSSVEAYFKHNAVKSADGTATYGQNNLHIYGSATINTLDLTIAVTLATAHLSTETVMFPLSHYWNISLHRVPGSTQNAVVDSTKQDIKLWPKAQLTIGEGVTLKLDKLAVYSTEYISDKEDANYGKGKINALSNISGVSDNFLYESGSGSRPIDVHGDAVLNIAGTLEVNTFGGLANPVGPNAKLVISSAGSLAAKEINTVGTSADTCVYCDFTFVAEGHMLVGAEEISTDPAELGVNTYLAAGYDTGEKDNDGNSIYGYAWLNHTANITLNANGGTVSPESITVDIGTGGIADITQITNIVPTLTDYKFMGWYLDENLTTAFNSTTAQSIKYDATLYAKWELSKTVTVHFETYGGTAYDDITVTLTPSGISLADFNKIDGKIPTLSNHRFDGWFMDSEFTSPISQTSIPNNASEITVYALWTEIEGKTYNVSFDLNSEGKTGVSEVEFGDTPAAEGTFEVPNTNKTVASDTDTSVQYYLAGWSTDPNAETGSFTFEITADTTLYAVWRTKAALTLDVSGNTGLGLTNDPSVWLKPGQSYDVAQFSNYSKLHGGDDDTANSKYYVSGFVVDEAKLAISGTTVTVMAGVDDTALAVTPAWKNKVSFTVDYGTHGTGKLGLANEQAYLKPGDTYKVTKDLTTGDSTTSISKYYDGSWTLSGVTLSTSDGIVFTVTATSGNATATVDWATKTKVTIDYGEYGSTLGFTDETVYLRPEESYTVSHDVDDVTVDPERVMYFTMWQDGNNQEVTLNNNVTYVNSSGAADVSLYAQWADKEVIIEYYSDGEVGNQTLYYYSGQIATILDDTKTGYTLLGWSTDRNGTEIAKGAGATGPVSESLKLYPVWEKNRYTITVTVNNATVKVNGTEVSNNGTVSIPYGDSVTVEVTYSQDSSQSTTIKGADGTTYTSPFNMPAQGVTINATSSSGCFAEGTLITMADGTLKPIEELTSEDVILVYDHETGSLTYMSNLFIINNGYNSYPLLRLFFSDGTSFDILFEHGLYDLNTNKYEILSPENVEEFIGHEFYMNKDGEGMSVTLVSYEIDVIETVCYSLMTPLYINHFANGLLCVSDGINGLYNIFEYDEDMKVDQEKKAADIEKYGISQYEEWADVFTYEQYIAFNVQYYHVIIGKGLCTDADIQYYIEKYLTRFE